MNQEQIQILEYLRSSLRRGKQFFKAKYIAADLHLSPHVVGVNLVKLSQIYSDLRICQYSRGNSCTTWHVSIRGG